MAGDLPTTTDRQAAMATCAYCPWQAKLFGDDMLDVVLSLRKILIAHIVDAHPEHATGTGAIIFREIDAGKA